MHADFADPIFNLDVVRMDRSLCNIIDEMNQVKDRL